MGLKKGEIKLTPGKYVEIIKKGYDGDILFLLSLAQKELSLSGFKNQKINAILFKMLRKGLLNADYRITEGGRNLLSFVKEKDSTPLKLQTLSSTNKDFDTWWSTYPGTDSVILKEDGKKKVYFKGSRSLKNGKDSCRIKFNKILSEKEYTAKELISALEYEVKEKVKRSIKERKNKMTYMKNTLSYLNQRAFEGFMDLIDTENNKEENKIDDTPEWNNSNEFIL